MIIFPIVNSYSDGVKNAVKAVVGCGFFPDAMVGRELFFLPWPSLLSIESEVYTQDFNADKSEHDF